MMPQAMSRALGYGAWGLTVGPLTGTDVLVVGTWRGLYVLDRQTLNVISSNTSLPFEQARPRHLQIGTILTGSHQLLVTTDMGDLAVFSSTLQPLAKYGEPGITKAILMNTGNPAQIALLSERDHVIKIEWNILTNSVTVLAVSPRVNGFPKDLELGTWNGNPALFALYGGTPTTESTIRTFDASTLLDVTAPPPNTQVGNQPSLYGNQWDLELVTANNALWFVVLAGGKLSLVQASVGGPGSFINLGTFAPMAYPLDIAVGELGVSLRNQTFSTEVAISTQPGYVAWMPLDDVLSSSTHAFPPPGLDPQTARGAGSVNTAPQFCNRAMVATWGMTTDQTPTNATPAAIELVDQSGSRWSVDRQGNTKFRYQLPFGPRAPAPLGTVTLHAGPFRDMFWVGNPTGTPGVVQVAVTDQTLAPGFQLPGNPSPSVLRIATKPYVPNPDATYRYLQFGLWENDLEHVLYSYDGFMLFPKAGHVFDLGPGNGRQAHWWSGQDLFEPAAWGNLVQGIYLDSANTLINSWWATTTGPPGVGNAGIAASSVNGRELRNALSGSFAMADAQSLRLFQNPGETPTKIMAAVGTPGGRVIVLRPETGPNTMTGTPVESADYGYGGAALAVAANGTTNQTDIYFGVISYYPNNQYHSGQSTDPSVDNMTGAVVALHWNGTAFSSSQLKILETGGEKAFGVCGIAVGDLIPTSPGDEIVVGTLDGKLLVYERLANGNFGALLYQTVLEGSVGAYNSMVIADLGPTPLAGNALYVAGSFGLRKFVYNPPPPLLNGQRR